jgi:hypothetical protein
LLSLTIPPDSNVRRAPSAATSQSSRMLESSSSHLTSR